MPSSRSRHPPKPQLSIQEVAEFLAVVYPPCQKRMNLLALSSMQLTALWLVSPDDYRPGGTLSGPTMFAAADAAFYALTLAMIGRQSLAVTSSLHIHFLRKPALVHLRCEARAHKLGRTSIVGDVLLFSEGMELPVAQASVSYAIPQPLDQR